MRITGGEFCGMRLAVPAGDKVRPTQDRVREALFSILTNLLSDAVFVDLYAGSGAVGLDALSRGAADVIWVEHNKRHLSCLEVNRSKVAPGRGRVVGAASESWCATGGRGLRADIIFADPPYEDARSKGFSALMRLLTENDVLKENGIFVAEMPQAVKAEVIESWELLKDRVYGQTRLALYQRITNGISI